MSTLKVSALTSDGVSSVSTADLVAVVNSSNQPTIRPSLLLDFANSKQVDPRITFTRASTATYFDAQGVLRTAASDVPRIDHDPVTGECKGLLIEEARTNLLRYSEQFDNAAWTKTNVSITADAVVAPDGTLTGEKLINAAGQSGTGLFGSSGIYENASSMPSGSMYTMSCYVKAGERNTIGLSIADSNFGTGGVIATANLSTLTTNNVSNATSTLISAGGGWYRFVVTSTTNLGATGTPRCYIYDPTVGDGSSGLYIWGAQIEAGAFPTSYIPTTSAAATRAADVARMSGSSVLSWYRKDEWTLHTESSSFMPSANYSIVALLNSTGSPHLGRHQTNSRGFGPSVSIDAGAGSYPTDVVVKQAMAARTNDFALSTNGGAVFADTTTGSVSTNISAFWIGNGPSLTAPLNGHLRRIAYYPKRLSNAELQALTA